MADILQKQSRNYDDIWNLCMNRKEYVLNDTSVLRVDKGENDYSLTYAVLLNGDIGERLSLLSKDISAVFPTHYYLPNEYFHISLGYLTKYGNDIDGVMLDRMVNLYRGFLHERLSKFKSVCVEVRGLNCFKNCIFAQVYDKEGILFDANMCIVKEFGLKNEFSFVPHIAMVYYRENPEELWSHIGKGMRDVYIGDVCVENISLVRWDLHRESDENAYRVIDSVRLL